MGNLIETVVWEAGVPYFEADAVLTGGPNCPDNIPIQALANRTAFLKKQLDDAVSGALNLGTASKWKTARSVSITGDATWTVTLDGSANVSAAMTLANSGVVAGTYRSVTVDAKGRVTAGTSPTTLAGYGITDAQPVDAELSAIAALAANGLIARTAAGAAAVRSIAAGAGVAVSNGDGVTGNPTVALAASGVAAGTYPKVTVDTYGRVTAGAALAAADIPALDWSKIASGKPTTLAGYGITDAQPLDSDLTALAALTSTGFYVNTGVGTVAARSIAAGAGLAVSNGDGVAGNPTVALAASGVAAGTYPKVTVDTYGRVTAGAALAAADIPALDWSKIGSGKPATLAGYGITDALTLSSAVPAALAVGGSAGVDSKAARSDHVHPLPSLALLGALAASDFTGANQSLAANGYQKLPGGLILQWGTYAAGVTSVTFPIAFPTACRAVVISNSYNGNSNIPGVDNYTTTGFRSSASSTTNVFIALGH